MQPYQGKLILQTFALSFKHVKDTKLTTKLTEKFTANFNVDSPGSLCDYLKTALAIATAVVR